MIALKRIAIFISGGGTTMEQVLLAIKQGRLPNVVPALIVSSRADAGGLAKAIAAGVDPANVLVIRPRDYQDEIHFGKALIRAGDERGVNLVFQCGWLAKTPPNVVKKYHNNIYNQHPGKLDTGYLGFGGEGMFGLRVHYVSLEFSKLAGSPTTEATVHRVTEKYDEGVIVGRESRRIYVDDTPETLQKRLLPFEHELVIKVVQQAATGTVEEWRRPDRLIETPEEAWLLGALISQAAKLYPKG